MFHVATIHTHTTFPLCIATTIPYLTTAAAIETMAHSIVSTPLLLAAVLLLLVQSTVEAFSSVRSSTCHRPSVTKKCESTTTTSSFPPLNIGRTAELRMANDDEEGPVGLPPLPSQMAQTAVADETISSQKKEEDTVVSSSSSAVEEETTSYPIDLPSPILLASSMVLAISSTGKKSYNHEKKLLFAL
jgi:hypothetical protein